jgi:putative transposase
MDETNIGKPRQARSDILDTVDRFASASPFVKLGFVVIPQKATAPEGAKEAQVTQTTRNFTDLKWFPSRKAILGRDPQYRDTFRSMLVREGIQVIRLPPQLPNSNGFDEGFVLSNKEECLSRMIFFGQAFLQHAIRQFMARYHTERNHQGF